jgi:hypothetical protein
MRGFNNRLKESTTATATPSSALVPPPSLLTAASILSTIIIIYVLQSPKAPKSRNQSQGQQRSTPLPGFGILGDRINEFIEIFLDALAIYVHK